MKNKIIFTLTAFALLCGTYVVNAANHVSHTKTADKPVSQVSDISGMEDDTMVYIQGYLTQNLGNEMYVFQDDSGTMTVEIDDDLMNQNSFSPTTLVWIAAEVDKKGDIISLDAEEIKFIPNQASYSPSSSSAQN